MGTVVVGAVVALVVALLSGLLSIAATHGTSMLPRFRPGDLAVLWASGSYRVGQVVAYQSPLLHSMVLHRIVGYRGGLFSFKGDNNAFVDPVRLPAGAIRGSLLLHIPDAGAWLIWLKGPRHLVLVLAGLLVLLVVEAPAVRWRAGTRPRRSPRSTSPTTELSGLKGADVALPLAVALAFGAIAGVAWSRPDVRPGTEPVPYSARMSFNYATPVAPSMVYPDGVVRTGQPIFLNLVSSIDVSAHFSFAATARHTPLTGTMTETVRLVYGTGWSTLLEQGPSFPLRSSQGTITVAVNLAHMAQVLAAADKTTGVEAAMPTVVVTPVVTFRGRLSGQPVSARYAPSLSFDVNNLEVNLADQASPGSSATSSALQQSRAGWVPRHVLKAATMTVMGRSARVSTLRDIGEAGVAASLTIALAGAAWARRRSRQEETAQIEARYGADLVGVRTSPEDGKRSVVDVVGISALAKVARAYGSLVLDHQVEGAHSYYVDAGTMVYRYRPGSAVAHEVQYAPGRHIGGTGPVISRLSQRALHAPLRGLSPSPWTFRIAPLSARREGDDGPP
jgi:signal peptidase